MIGKFRYNFKLEDIIYKKKKKKKIDKQIPILIMKSIYAAVKL